jgi:hypothetical protein
MKFPCDNLGQNFKTISHYIPNMFLSSSQKVSQIPNVFLKIFPIAPPFYPNVSKKLVCVYIWGPPIVCHAINLGWKWWPRKVKL